MPTIISQPAVPLSLAAIAGRRFVSPGLLVAGVVATALPDVDVIGFRMGIAYGDELGHRGFSHSLVFALLLGAISASVAPWLRSTRSAAFLFVGAACASHGLLDMLTTGGHGVAYLWPLSEERYFFARRVIKVSPLELRRFFGPEGLSVLLSELRWVWLPAVAAGIIGFWLRRKSAP